MQTSGLVRRRDDDEVLVVLPAERVDRAGEPAVGAALLVSPAVGMDACALCRVELELFEQRRLVEGGDGGKDEPRAARNPVQVGVLVRVARERARETGCGPLAGWSVAVKDIIDLAGMPTRCNADFVPVQIPEALNRRPTSPG